LAELNSSPLAKFTNGRRKKYSPANPIVRYKTVMAHRAYHCNVTTVLQSTANPMLFRENAPKASILTRKYKAASGIAINSAVQSQEISRENCRVTP